MGIRRRDARGAATDRRPGERWGLMVAGWTKHGDGKTLAPGEVVRPDERLSWPRMIGFGAQHVIAMFGATFVFPLVMGLSPNIAIMFSGVATIMFLLIV